MSEFLRKLQQEAAAQEVRKLAEQVRSRQASAKSAADEQRKAVESAHYEARKRTEFRGVCQQLGTYGMLQDVAVGTRKNPYVIFNIDGTYRYDHYYQEQDNDYHDLYTNYLIGNSLVTVRQGNYDSGGRYYDVSALVIGIRYPTNYPDQGKLIVQNFRIGTHDKMPQLQGRKQKEIIKDHDREIASELDPSSRLRFTSPALELPVPQTGTQLRQVKSQVEHALIRVALSDK